MKKFASIGTILALWTLIILLAGNVILIFPGWVAIDQTLKHTEVLHKNLDGPAWVQAIGSIAAIFAAIGIAMWQRHSDRKDSSKKEWASAHVVTAGLLATLPAITLMLRTIEDGTAATNQQNAYRRSQIFINIAASVELPRESDMMNLLPVLPEIANLLAKASVHYRQIMVLLNLAGDDVTADPQWVVYQLMQVAQACTMARVEFTKAEEALEEFSNRGIH